MLTFTPKFKSRKQASAYIATRTQRVKELVMMLLDGEGTHFLTLADAVKTLRHFIPDAAKLDADELQQQVNQTLAQVVPDEAHKLVYIEGAACAPVEKSNRHSNTVATDLREAVAMVRCMMKERAYLLGI